MEQHARAKQPIPPRKRPLTEEQRARIWARIIDVILSDPGRPPDEDAHQTERHVEEQAHSHEDTLSVRPTERHRARKRA
jgi:hypothetical protein